MLKLGSEDLTNQKAAFGVSQPMTAWYFLSETIHAKENGSRGTHFAKFLISNFLKSLTYSALVAIESSYLTSVCVSMCVCKLVTQVQV